MRLSVVTSLYCSRGHLEEFYRRVTACIEPLAEVAEIVLVNDACPDGSLDVARRLVELDDRVVVVDLLQNVGQHRALTTGLHVATGERVFLADCDLEEPPEVLAALWAALEAHPRTEAAYGYQVARRGGALERTAGRAYYRLLSIVHGLPIVADTLLARLMTRRYVDAVIELAASNPNLDILFARTGLPEIGVPLPKARLHPTTYTLWRRLRLVGAGLGARRRPEEPAAKVHAVYRRD